MKVSSSNFAGLKSFVVPTLILVTIVLIVPFAFIPLLENVGKTNSGLEEQRERLDGLSTKIDVLDSLDEKDINEKLSLAEQALPVGKSIAPLLVGVQRLAINSNLKIQGITLNPGKVATQSATIDKTSTQDDAKKTVSAQKEASKNAVTMQLELSGSLRNVEKFLKQLQGSKRLSFAEELDIQTSEEKDVEISIRLSTPFRTLSVVEGNILDEPIPVINENNLATLEFTDGLVNITNIQIKEVPTNVKDPFGKK
jgi:hypothetical protein